MTKLKIVIGVTGASGSIYGKLLLDKLASLHDQIEACGVILSENAKKVWSHELRPFDPAAVPFTLYPPTDLFAPVASGSAGYHAMIICPCTMGTLGRIAAGVADDLMTRAADVMLKERKRLILVPREAPLSLIHLDNMKRLTEAGAIILPASPSFYSRPKNIEELLLTVVDRALELAGFTISTYRWGN